MCIATIREEERGTASDDNKIDKCMSVHVFDLTWAERALPPFSYSAVFLDARCVSLRSQGTGSERRAWFSLAHERSGWLSFRERSDGRSACGWELRATIASQRTKKKKRSGSLRAFECYFLAAIEEEERAELSRPHFEPREGCLATALNNFSDNH